MKFSAQDQVRKVGGSYEADGVIVAAFKTLGGAERYVFEFVNPAGMLHIFGPDNLMSREPVEPEGR